MLKRDSRSFYLSLVLLPPARREPLSLGHLLARTADTITDAGSLPAEGVESCWGNLASRLIAENSNF